MVGVPVDFGNKSCSWFRSRGKLLLLPLPDKSLRSAEGVTQEEILNDSFKRNRIDHVRHWTLER